MGIFVSSRGIADFAKKELYDCYAILDVGSGNKTFGNLPLKNILTNKEIESLDSDPKSKPDIVASALNIPEPDKTYDCVFSSHCLEHLDNSKTALLEWKRVLKDNGKLVVTVPFNERKQSHHKTVFTSVPQLKVLAEECGFRDIKAEQRLWVKFFQPFLGRILGKGDLVLICRK